MGGRDGSVYLMGWTGGYVLLALLLAPYLRKFGKYTVPDFVGDRYYSRAARVVAVVCAIFVSFTYVAGQMRGVGIVFSRFLNVEITSGVLIGMGIVFFYAVLGGMKGITYTQVAQYCVLIFAYLVPAIFISLLMTGNIIPQLGFGGTLADGSGEFLLDRLNGLSRDLGFHLYTDGSKGTMDVFCITAALMVGTAGLPHVIVRFYTVPRVAAARSFCGLGAVFHCPPLHDGSRRSCVCENELINNSFGEELSRDARLVQKLGRDWLVGMGGQEFGWKSAIRGRFGN